MNKKQSPFQTLIMLNERVAVMSAPKMSIKDQTFFVKRLAFLIKANVSILEGLHMVKEQTRRGGHVRIIERVIEDVSNGQSLSRSLGKFPDVFGDFGVNLIKVGESSGTLAQNLEYLADELKKRYVLKKKITGALVYPGVIALATVGITAFLVLYLFPKIMPIFSSLHTELPWTTKVVIALSTYLQHSWWQALLAIVILSVTIAIALRRSKRVKYLFHQALLSLPVVGRMARHYNLANMSRTLGLLLKSGLTLSDALPLTADTTQNLVYRKAIHKLSEGVMRGERLSLHLKKDAFLFPEVLSQMVSVGEHSGNLSNTLLYLSELYDGEVEEFTKNISTLVEPVMMVVMGLVVGFIAISIITPIYGITQNITPYK